MKSPEIRDAFSSLSTPVIVDACLRVGAPLNVAPAGIGPAVPGRRLAGHALPVVHHGSVDVFLEAMGTAAPGDVLLIDNGGRMDEACIGDLTALEAEASGLGSMVVWGAHRDTPELEDIELPVFSYGRYPGGPQRPSQPEPDGGGREAKFGAFSVGPADVVFADADGVVFTDSQGIEEVLTAAEAIQRTERAQADAVRSGTRLRDQLKFEEYQARRASDPSYTFRRHLRSIGGAIEE